MTFFAFALVLTAAFCHATWNFFVKRVNAGPEFIWLFSIVSVFLYLPAIIYILVIERPTLGLWQIVFIICSSVTHIGYFLLLQAGYRKGDLSLVYPTARATGPFLSTIFAVIILGELLSAQIAIGAMAVIAGVVFLTGGFKRGAENLKTSLFFGLGAGLLIGTYTVWDAYAVSVLLIPPLVLDYASSLGRSVFLAPVAFKRWDLVNKQWRDHRREVFVIAAFNPLAYILVLYALTFTPVVYVAPTREISVLLTVIMGSILLKEGDLKRRLMWAALMLSGIVLLATA